MLYINVINTPLCLTNVGIFILALLLIGVALANHFVFTLFS